MENAAYNEIVTWYDQYIQENPFYSDMLLPSLLECTGDVQGQHVCDLACGQGWFARMLANRGARVTGIDYAEGQLARAREYKEPEGIVYLHDDAQEARSLPDHTFDGCVCILALMDIPDHRAVFHTARRVLKAGGWLVFAIMHPCFEAPEAGWIANEQGKPARVISRYTREGFWKSTSGGVRSRVGAYHRTLSSYTNALIDARFALTRMLEPRAGDRRLKQVPGNQEIPSLLIVRAVAME
ncbi:methyltransferase family protein [Thermosporothrix hazakensis]|jgi:ubiquinone/menaquinone biosynthesis C-methylase UbiE|uniref:Methyltransferase family protein n=2 Tax=Thermosporothrix TaxID=768650 RepID=A0A326UMB6_THEHA|nr:class I SAM-dependent methyltransferase [Thermosporothrix hazakensis]PZW31085.1 methyltransferase family protein [Thermosporothrix hazakensis]BBH86694.1 methyltransferase [Thermosporothrix sp. COM3]GCE51000.1 methyltransferase [Thermosporothrix hazakensis]